MQQTDVLGRRIGAGVIDIGIVLVIVLLVGGIVGNDTAPDAPDSARFGTLDRLLILFLAFGYYWISEALWAQTLGKRVLGIRVGARRRLEGRASARRSCARSLRAVDGLPAFYLVGLVAIFATGPRRQRIGDLAAKTRVVAADAPTGAAPPPPPPSDEDVLASIMR